MKSHLQLGPVVAAVLMTTRLVVQDAPGGIRVITFSNPSRRNALGDAFWQALERAIVDSKGVRAFLVRAAGSGIFSAGYDLRSLVSHAPRAPGERLPDEYLGHVLDALSNHPAPSVALVTGLALGAGCELAVACDFRVGDASAAFGMPPAKLGVIYSLKGMRRVISRVGEGFARYLFLSGRRVDAYEAFRRGLLDVLAPDAEAQAWALCSELAENAPSAIAGMKGGLVLLRSGGTLRERRAFEKLRRASFCSEEAQEGLAAALGKRRPHFPDRIRTKTTRR